ncbi:transposase [Bradyrhizobium sp. LM2.7]
MIQGRSWTAPDQGSHRNRGCLPAHLPQVERIIEPATTLCPCGCGAMTKIGEDVSKRLDVIPAQWRVLITRRPKYICRRCSGPVVQAHAPEHVVPSGLPTEAAIAHVIVSKFGDHTPFYRQAEIYARQGIRLDRATLGNWSGRACFHLQPIADHMRRHLAMADRLFMDETTAPVLDPGAAKRRKATSGRSCPMTAATAAQVRRSCCSDMPPVAAVPSLSSSWTALADASCNAMPMAVMTG